MPGLIKRMLDSIISQRAKGNQTLVMTTKTKLILKGVDPDGYNGASADDPVVLEKVRKIAGELGVSV